MTELVDLTIAEAGEQLKTGRISSTELVAATLRRIEQTEPVVHAYARVLADSARVCGFQFGRVSRYGVEALATSLDHVGPMTRTVEDCAILLQAIAGYDPRDSGSVAEPVPDYRADLESGVAGLTIGVERDYFFYDGVTDEIRAMVNGVIAEFEAMGATIVDVKLPHLELMSPTGLTILLAEASTIHRRLLREHAEDYDPATRRMLELGEFVPATHYLTAQRARTLLRRGVKDVFQANGLDAMAWPTLPMTTVPLDKLAAAREDGKAGTPILAMIHHTFSANITGQPALSVPCGLSGSGLPVGFQLLGRPFAEATLFRMARAYERAHTWSTLSPPRTAYALAG